MLDGVGRAAAGENATRSRRAALACGPHRGRAIIRGSLRYVPIVQRPRTWPFQGQNTGSNPVGDARLRSASPSFVWASRAKSVPPKRVVRRRTTPPAATRNSSGKPTTPRHLRAKSAGTAGRPAEQPAHTRTSLPPVLRRVNPPAVSCWLTLHRPRAGPAAANQLASHAGRSATTTCPGNLTA